MKVDSSIRSQAGKCLAVLSVAACAFLATPACGEDARPETDSARVPIALVVDDEALRQAMMSLDRSANDTDDVQGQIDRTLRECESRIAEIVRRRLGLNVHVQKVTGMRLFAQMLNNERVRSQKDGLSRAQAEKEKMERQIKALKDVIEALKDEKVVVEDQLRKSKSEAKELKDEVASLKEEVTAAKDETLVAKEALEKAKETIEQLKTILQKQVAGPRAAAGPVTGSGRLTPSDKGTILTVNNEKLYVVVKFDDAALDELIGSDHTGTLPPHEMIVARKVKGAYGRSQQARVVGKIRLRQWTPKTNLVIADILQDWQQAPFEEGDVVRPN